MDISVGTLLLTLIVLIASCVLVMPVLRFIMPSVFQYQGYEALISEEKMSLDDTTPSGAKHRGRWQRRLLTIWTPILLIGVFLIALLSGDVRQKCFGRANTTQELPDEKAFLKHATRALGDRYLLGVGKADITGSVG